MKRSPIKKSNPKRKLKVKTTVWGPPGYKKHVTERPCAVRGCKNRPSEPHHEPHRYPQGRGTWRDLVPLCGDHHTKGSASVHTIGVDTFAEMFDIKWEEIKEEVYALWLLKKL